MTLLREYAGAVLDGTVPGRNAPEWRDFRQALLKAGAAIEGLRSWQAVYTCLHQKPAPNRVIRRQLLGQFPSATLRRAGASTAPAAGLPSGTYGGF